MYEPAVYSAPNFCEEIFLSSPDIITAKAQRDGVLPDDFHATSIFPEYYKINGEWKLIKQSRMDCCVVIKNGEPFAIEQRNVKKNDAVVIGRIDSGSLGIYLHSRGFSAAENSREEFSFREGRTRETSYSMDYDSLYKILRFEKKHGYIVWVLGPAVSFDYDSRNAMARLIDSGYVQHIFAGNALATHDLEAAYFGTALGQNVYTQKSVPNGHYHHLQTINDVCCAGSIKQFIAEKNIDNGIMYSLEKNGVGYILAGSIRDDGPLPETIPNVYEAQQRMRSILKNATMVIGLATQLHTIATGNMTPSYTISAGKIRQVNFYTVDISEFAVNKLRDRGSLSVTSIVTNVQDFLVHIEKGLRLL